MGFRGHTGKCLFAAGIAVLCFIAQHPLKAATVTWNQGGTGGDTTFDLNSAANWTGGFPGTNNSFDAVMIFNAGGGNNKTQTITNAPSDNFVASSLSLTNTSSKIADVLTMSGQAFLTNGTGALNIGGGTGGEMTTVTFLSNVTFNVLNFGGGGNGNSTLTFGGGKVTASNLTFTGNSSSVNRFIVSAPTMNLSSNFSVSAGDANNTVLISNSTVTVAGRLSVAGNQTDQYFTLTNASLTVSNGVANNGKIDIFNSATLTSVRAWTNNGVLNLAGGTLAGAALTNQANGTVVGFGSVSNALVNGGLVTAANGELVLLGAATSNGTYRAVAGASAATLTFAGGGSISALFNTNATVQLKSVLTNAAVFANQGTLVLAGSTYQSTANLTNAAGKFIVNSGAGTINAAGVFNLGTILATNATVTLSNLVQGGTVTIGSGGTVSISGALGLTNFGTINLIGAAGGGNNAILNLGSLVLTNLSGGTVTGGGVIQNSSQVINLTGGSILATSTVVELQFTNASTLGNAGTIGAATGATLTFGTAGVGSAIITNFGTINLTGGTLRSGVITNFASGFLGGIGTITAQVINQGRADLGATIASNFLQTAGSFTVNGSATITGTTTINGGTLDLAGGRLTNGLLVIGSGGTLTNGVQNATLNGGITNAGLVNLFRDTYINGPLTNTGTWIQRGAISNNVVNSGTMTLLTNSINLRVTGSIVNSGSLTFDTNGTIYVNGVVSNSGSFSFGDVISNNLVNTAGAITLNGTGTVTGNTSINGGVLDLNGKTYSNGLMVVSGTGVLTNSANGATVNGGLSNAATVAVTANTFFNGVITNTGMFVMQGAISNNFVNSGTLALNNSTTIATGALINNSNGRVNVTNGALRLLVAPTQNGTIDVALNSTLNVTPLWANSGALLLDGGFVVGSNVTNSATARIAGFGTVSNTVVNLGILTATNGTLNLVNAPLQNGTFNVAGLGTLNVAQAWNNAGAVNMLNGTLLGGILTNAGSITGSGSITGPVVNNSGASITASGGGTLALLAIPLQNGAVNILGTLNVASAWSNGNAGTVTLNGGALTGGTFTVDGIVTGHGTIAANMVIGNAKTVTINGGQMNLTALTTMDGGVINGGPVINYGTVSGDGTISAALSNPGYVRATNGLLYIQALTGNQATGTLEASTGGTLQANGITPWLNKGQVILSGGTVIGGDISNNASKVISGFGTISPNVHNSGQILASNPGQALTLNNSLVNLTGGIVAANTGNLIINGAFTNAGTLNMVHSVGTFSGAVVNSGAWITDPTTNVFQNTYTITSSGYIQSSPGDVYIFTNNATTAANFINVSTNKSQYNTQAGDFVFANTLGLTQVFAAAGHDFGPATSLSTNQIQVLNPDPLSLSQYSNNFALGTLEISDFTTVRVTDAFSALGPGTNDNLEAALYLDNLYLGSNSLLLISANVQLYFINSNDWTVANIELEGNPGLDNSLNGIHQFAVIPEPGVLVLWLSGIATIHTARKRYARLRK